MSTLFDALTERPHRKFSAQLSFVRLKERYSLTIAIETLEFDLLNEHHYV